MGNPDLAARFPEGELARKVPTNRNGTNDVFKEIYFSGLSNNFVIMQLLVVMFLREAWLEGVPEDAGSRK